MTAFDPLRTLLPAFLDLHSLTEANRVNDRATKIRYVDWVVP
jgi:hypothetical protein